MCSGTVAYYKAEDANDLSRGELIKLISYARKMCLKVMGTTTILVVLLYVCLIRGCHAAEPRTPDDFDWSLMKVAPKVTWNGLYINLTEVPQPMVAEHHAMFADDRQGQIGEHQVVFVNFIVGIIWQTILIAVGAGGVATAIQGCVTTGRSNHNQIFELCTSDLCRW